MAPIPDEEDDARAALVTSSGGVQDTSSSSNSCSSNGHILESDELSEGLGQTGSPISEPISIPARCDLLKKFATL